MSINWSLYRRALIFIIYPIKRIDYYETYYSLTQQILKSPRKAQLFHLLNLLICFKCFHFLFLALYSANFTDFQRILHFNALYLLIEKNSFNLFGPPVASVILYFNCLLFRGTSPILISLLNEIIIRKNESIFLQKQFHSMPICAYIKQFFIVLLNGFQSMLFVIDFLFLYTHSIFTYKLFIKYQSQLFQLSPLSRLLVLAYHYFGALSYWIFMYNLSHCLALFFSIGSALVLIFYIKQKQTFQYLCSILQHRQSDRLIQPKLTHFYKQFHASLQLLFEINQMYSKPFLAFIAVSIPLNAVFTVWLIFGHIQHINCIIIGFFIAYQYNVMFAVHLCLTACIANIYRHNRVLFSLFVRCNSSFRGIKCRLKLVHLIFLLMNKRRYGFTYGPFGLITMGAFVKFLQLYGKVIMWSMRLVARIEQQVE